MVFFMTILLSALTPVLFFLVAAFEPDNKVPKPMWILGWILLVGFTFKGIYLAFVLHEPFSHRLTHLGPDNVWKGVWVTFLCCSLIIVGYLLTPNGRLKHFKKRLKLSHSLVFYVYFGLFWLSVILFVLFFQKMGFASQLAAMRFTSQKFYELSDGQTTSLGFLTIGGDFLLIYGLYYFVFTPKIKVTSLYFIVILFLFLTYFLASRRSAALIMFILFLMVMGVRNFDFRRFKKWKAYLGIASLVVVLSFTSAIRDTGRTGATLGEITVGTAISTTIHHAMYGAYFMDPAKTGAIMSETKKRNLFQYGNSYTGILVAPIPRALWAGKPPVRKNHFIAQDLLKIDSSRTGAPPSGLAELYLNFGWVGMLVGSLLLGSVLKLKYNTYLKSDDKRFARVPYAAFMICVVMFMMADFAMATIFAVKYAMAIFICSRFWRWKESRNALVA